MLSAITGLIGVVIGWLLNYWTSILHDERRTRQERITAANTLLAEIDMIRERVQSINTTRDRPENPKRDYNKALYYSLQPKLGIFKSETVRALVRFYQGIERIEAEAYAHNAAQHGNDQKKHFEDWAKSVENAQKNLLGQVEKALNSEIGRPKTSCPGKTNISPSKN